MSVLDDVGKEVPIVVHTPIFETRHVYVVMAIVAPNGDCCRIFKPDPRDPYLKQAKAVRAFMENHNAKAA